MIRLGVWALCFMVQYQVKLKLTPRLEPPKCPFKVGDRVRYKKEIRGSWPEATVVEITEHGFKYRFGEPFLISPRIGSTIGGECYETGFDVWELAAVSSTQPDAAKDDVLDWYNEARQNAVDEILKFYQTQFPNHVVALQEFEDFLDRYRREAETRNEK